MQLLSLLTLLMDNNGDDEDAVTFPTLARGTLTKLDVTVNQATANKGYLQAWIDWNGDGDFNDPGANK